MLSIQNLRRKCLLPIIIFLMGTLFLITTRRPPNSHRSVNLIFSQDPNAKISQSFIPSNLHELKADIYGKKEFTERVQEHTSRDGKILSSSYMQLIYESIFHQTKSN